jgi:medium-chain acyl-[acyl-carrier-protein] hydrolase
MTDHGRWHEERDAPRAGPSPFKDLCSLLGEAAGAHATHLGLGLPELQSKDLTWMLSRLLVRIDRYPAPGERLSIWTWPSGVARLFALREFRVVASDGTPVALGTSAWFIVSLSARRPISPDPHVAHIAVQERAIHGALETRIEAPPTGIQLALEAVIPEDIDENNHVTFTSYLGWIEQALRSRLPSGIAELEINYLAEVFLGDSIRVESADTPGDDGRLLVQLTSEATGEPVARAAVRAM